MSRKAALLFFAFLAELSKKPFQRFDDFVALHAGLPETDLEIELLGWRPIREDVMLRPAGLGLGNGLPKLLAGRAALAGDSFDEGGHFFRRFLSNHL